MNIVLIGFMGTGKTSVGRLLANRLGYDFIDTDAVIERLEGRSISEIFATDGERYFRNLEAEQALILANADRRVVATGGGFPLNPKNIELLHGNSVIVLLQASPQTILERVQPDQNRPLLQVDDPLSKIESLLVVRAAFYAVADITVDTSDKDLQEVAEFIHTELIRRGNLHGESES